MQHYWYVKSRLVFIQRLQLITQVSNDLPFLEITISSHDPFTIIYSELLFCVKIDRSNTLTSKTKTNDVEFVHFYKTDCGNIQMPANGSVSLVGGTTFGQFAKYQCETGFNLIGNETRKCEAFGNWTGEPPSCEIKGNPSAGTFRRKIGLVTYIDNKFNNAIKCYHFEFWNELCLIKNPITNGSVSPKLLLC